jgi:hypothetical protein
VSRGYIIQHLKQNLLVEKDTAVVYYFFDYSEKRSLKASTFVRSVLHQIITPELVTPDIQLRLESLFPSNANSEPDIRLLQAMFLEFCGNFRSIYLLVDGLDEADEVCQSQAKILFEEIQKIQSVRSLATTHAALDMSKILSNVVALHVQPDDLKHDIEIFVTSKIEIYSQAELAGCPSAVLDLIKLKLLSDSEGM